ncbi:hypothetical protein [Psychrobacter sp. I-STPA6b]|uniref:hypothetical protein n=1 Tax=Psychrobacter sp. I-STPA6b TaxID=2585718 RepID=UPI001D0C8EC1|nr:hypothetical protein [Psychrobacter sp. I-STPA6b]
MKILIEGETYPIDILEEIFDDARFYSQNSYEATITTVGYYHSLSNNQLVYMLPKVFMSSTDKELTIFGINKNELLHIDVTDTFKHDSKYQWIRQLIIYFYNSLREFQKRNNESILLHKSNHYLLQSNISSQEYTYLDLLLTFINFYKKNKNLILYRHIQSSSKSAKKTSWSKTISKKLPLINNMGQPIYNQFINKNKLIDKQEELLVYFFSILQYLNKEHSLNISIDKSYKVIQGSAFESLKLNGLNKLKKIKYRYFSDVYRSMYRLCELYFSKSDWGSKYKNSKEFITIDNYNIVFEDMIDKLFSKNSIESDFENTEGLSLKDLKNHPDGKIIDHIYSDKSLIDNSNIFYIGDSKYYKPYGKAGKSSQFKQFTYAKNVIQFNIDILNQKNKLPNNLRYRDDITEGYNITPNFFIYGYIDDYHNFDDALLEPKSDVPISSSHFSDRLFDRDTLFIHEYKINFLFVLKSYTSKNEHDIQAFRDATKRLFREKFINFFNSPDQSGFFIIKKDFETVDELIKHVNCNFRKLNGKCISIDNSLLIAKPLELATKEDEIDQYFFS